MYYRPREHVIFGHGTISEIKTETTDADGGTALSPSTTHKNFPAKLVVCRLANVIHEQNEDGTSTLQDGIQWIDLDQFRKDTGELDFFERKRVGQRGIAYTLTDTKVTSVLGHDSIKL